MPRTTMLTAILLLPVLGPAIAQRGGPSRTGERTFGGSQLPAPGTMLPSVAAIDERGGQFSTASLRGSYTVLVFGCLT